MDDWFIGALGQPGVHLPLAVLVGAIAGWIAERVTKADMGIFANIFMGIIGAVVGNFLARQLGISIYGFWQNLISATLGAILVIFAYRAIRGRTASG